MNVLSGPPTIHDPQGTIAAATYDMFAFRNY